MTVMLCRYQVSITWNFGPDILLVEEEHVRADQALNEAGAWYLKHIEEVVRTTSGDRLPVMASVMLYDYQAESAP